MSSTESAENAIRDLGFYYHEDAAVGTKVSSMIQQRLNPLSKEGLEFYEANVLNDKRILSILNSLLLPSSYAMARYGNFWSDPDHIFQFRRGGESLGPRVLVVQLWEKGSRAVYYNRSHLYPLPPASAANGLFEVRLSALVKAGCSEGTTIDFEHGGITIQDARTAFEITQGAANATIFATDDIFVKWPPMVLPNTPDVEQKVVEIRGAQPPGLHARLETVEANKQYPTASSHDIGLKPLG